MGRSQESSGVIMASAKVIISTPQPARSQGSKTARHNDRKGRGKRKNRLTSPQDADSDDPDEDAYVDAEYNRRRFVPSNKEDEITSRER
jgi:hypothetical protein